MNIKTTIVSAVAAAAIASSAAPAFATPPTTTTGTLTVNGTVSNNCTVTSPTLSFTGYDPVVTNATTALAVSQTFTVTCTKGDTNVTIGLGNGANSSNATGTTRAMKDSASDYLSYELYTTAAHTSVWSNSTTVGVTPNGLAQTQTIYGVGPAGQNVPSTSSYSDAVTITVSF